MLEICLRIAGVLLILLAIAHVTFPKRFHWTEELSRLSLLNRQIFLVHVFFIVVLVGSMGVLCAVFTHALVERSTLARLLLAWLCLFWLTRLVVQWFVYDRRLWHDDRFHLAVHIVFTALWSYLAAVYGWAFWQQMS